MVKTGFVLVQIKKMLDPVKFGAFKEKFIETHVKTGVCKVVYLAPAVEYLEAGAASEGLPMVVLECPTVEAAVNFEKTPIYQQCKDAAGGDMTKVVTRDIRVVEMEAGCIDPANKGYWFTFLETVSDQESFDKYFAAAGPSIIEPKLYGIDVKHFGKPVAFSEAGMDEPVVVVEFESLKAAKSLYTSPEYKKAVSAGNSAGDATKFVKRDIRVVGTEPAQSLAN